MFSARCAARDELKPLLQVNRYLVFEEIAAGGMASVHFGRLVADSGFSRTVAIKRLHPHIAKDPAFVSTLLDEARLASRIRHPNVVPTLDLVNEGGEVFVVMEYVDGESLARLFRSAIRAGQALPLPVCSAILGDLLLGLHAAHEALDDRGEPLSIVHRDVSPQNVLVGLDGIARVVDFGVAKAASRLQTTSEGQLKGKLAYMSPEQLELKVCDRRADIFAVGVLAWELCTGRRLFSADSPAQTMAKVLSGEVMPPSKVVASLPKALDAVVLRALARDPAERFDTALEMAEALHEAIPRAAALEVRHWVKAALGSQMEERAKRLAAIEASTSTDSSLRPVQHSVEHADHTATDLSATTPHRTARRGKRTVFAALAFVAVLGLVVVLLGPLVMRRIGSGGVSSESGGLADAHEPRSSSSPGREALSQEPDVVASAAPLPAHSVAASASSPPTRGDVPPRKVPRPAAPKTVKPAKNCNPNFYIDKHGQKRFKEECFK